MPNSRCCFDPFSCATVPLNCICSLVVELRNGSNKICIDIALPHGLKGCIPYPVDGFLEISETLLGILLMLEVLFTQDSEVEDMFCCASSGFELGLFFSNYLFGFGSKYIQDDFQHDFARVTDEADGSVVLAEL